MVRDLKVTLLPLWAEGPESYVGRPGFELLGGLSMLLSLLGLSVLTHQVGMVPTWKEHRLLGENMLCKGTSSRKWRTGIPEPVSTQPPLSEGLWPEECWEEALPSLGFYRARLLLTLLCLDPVACHGTTPESQPSLSRKGSYVEPREGVVLTSFGVDSWRCYSLACEYGQVSHPQL